MNPDKIKKEIKSLEETIAMLKKFNSQANNNEVTDLILKYTSELNKLKQLELAND